MNKVVGILNIHSWFFKNSQLGIERSYLILIKSICKNLKLTSYLNGKTLTLFLRSGIGQGCLLSLLIVNIAVKVLTTAVRQEKEIKGIHIRKKVKLYLFEDDIIYIEHLIETTKKAIRTNVFGKLKDTRSIF